jgi:hypothetical protein
MTAQFVFATFLVALALVVAFATITTKRHIANNSAGTSLHTSL